jgi:nucleotide-binding universal stress UspA family protein
MYETILVPTDGSAPATAAADHAVALAQALGATVHALYVADLRMTPVSTADDETARRLVEESDASPTAPVVERAEDAGVTAVDAVRVGVPHEVILEYVAEHDVDLVVMGTHGRSGVERALLGSVADRVVRTADVPVVTVRD